MYRQIDRMDEAKYPTRGAAYVDTTATDRSNCVNTAAETLYQM
jgi:hypothetical protein